jgi:hypothetical protein
MSDNVIRFPGGHLRRKRLDERQGIVRCEVSGRWLQMPSQAHQFDKGTYLAIDVMTKSGEGKSRKLCELVLLKEDILKAVAAIPVKD